MKLATSIAKKLREILGKFLGKDTARKIVKVINTILDNSSEFFGWTLDKTGSYLRKIVEFLNTVLGQTGKLMVTLIAIGTAYLIQYTFFGMLSSKATPDDYAKAISAVEPLTIALLGIMSIIVTIGLSMNKIVKNGKTKKK